jgi:hypothetical protein
MLVTTPGSWETYVGVDFSSETERYAKGIRSGAK